MNIRKAICGTLAAGVLFVISSTVMAQAPPTPGGGTGTTHDYSIVTSGTSIYMVGGDLSSPHALVSMEGSFFSDIEVYGQTVYALDQATKMLRVGTISGSGTASQINWVNSISLSSGSNYVSSPKRLSVNASQSGVYVIGDSSYYAYVTSGSNNWLNPTVSLGNISGSAMYDVATYGTSEAVLAHENYNSGTLDSHVSSLNGTSPSGTTMISDNYSPKAIATLSVGNVPMAYVVNNWMASPNQYEGSLVAMNADTRQLISTRSLGSFSPFAVTTFTVSGTSYVGMVGESAGSVSAFRIALNSNGGFTPNTIMSQCSLGDTATAGSYNCALSASGSIFWLTNPTSGKVYALDSSSWTNISGNGYELSGANAIAGYVGNAVPEPSSLAALIAPLAAMGLGVIRRKRSA